MSDARPFEEYKEIIKDMRKEEMIKGLYDLSARVTKQENIIKEVREYITKQVHRNQQFYEMDIENILEILDKKEVN